ncbi:MAG TPA: plastocyanin/azurin family copper-binding protein, partial [Gemmatimonadales bacterium]|nr:plastocyanin/azurin family copper-binding protein [Gemmatimonadales bacterium]
SISPAQGFTGPGGAAEATRTLGAGTGTQTASATASELAGSPAVTFTTTAATTVIRVANNVFLPATVTIQAGDSVAWQWQTGSVAHNLTFAAAPGSPANEPDRSAGAVWRSFPAAGTFTYQCANHAGMTGTVAAQP